MSRTGRLPKWGEPTSALSVRWPKSHRELYERRARELGLSMSEYIVRVVAEAHGLDLAEDQEQLPLTA